MTNEYRLPEHWKKWELEEILGAGAYGTVFRAGNVDDPEQFAAIKIIPIPKDSAEASALYREYGSMEEVSGYYSQIVTELVNEIQTLMSLKGCNNIVQIEDYHVEKSKENEYGWTIYIRMELLVSLQEYLQTHEASEELAIKVGLDVCDALIECEKARIIHRDIKPDNILVSEEGTFKLGDFGVAKRLTGTESSFSVKGTFSYMSPEVYYGRPYDHTADIYSLGIVLFKLLNHNRDPFIDISKQLVNHRDKENAMGKRMSGKPIPAPAYASEGMSKIIQKACAFLPEDRYQSAAELKEALEKLQEIPGEDICENSDNDSIYNQSEPEDVKPAVKEKEENDLRKGTVERIEKKNKIIWLIPVAVMIAIVSVAGIFIQRSFRSNKLLIDHEPCSQDGKVVCTLDRNGLLIIEGVGELDGAEGSFGFPWEFYNDEDEDKSYAIRKVIIRKGITSIGNSAFRSCIYLSEVVLPEGLESIGDSSFLGCVNLSKINQIPQTLCKIGPDAFKSTRWIEDQREENGFIIINGILIDYNGKEKEVKIPKQVKTINFQAFRDNELLKKVILPEGLQSIRADAFCDCVNLRDVINLEGNSSIIEIEGGAFYNTKWLEFEISKGNGYAVIDKRLFAYEGKEKKIAIPNDVEEILEDALAGDETFSEITLSPNVRIIGKEAFHACPNLKKINFNGAKVEEIPKEAFRDCVSLKGIALPETVKIIEEKAFFGCVNLEKISISKGVEHIEPDAFEGCDKIKEVEGASELNGMVIKEGFGYTEWYKKVYSNPRRLRW